MRKTSHFLIVYSVLILGISVSFGDRDNTNHGKNCREALSFSLFHKETIDNFGYKFATESDAKFIVQVTLEDARTSLIKAKCTGSLLHPNWVITSSDCGREVRQGASHSSGLSFKVSTGINFGDSPSAKLKSSSSSLPSMQEVYHVSQALIVSPNDSICSPMLLRLDRPIHHKTVVCLTPSHASFRKSIISSSSSSSTSRSSLSFLTKALTTGWSTFDSVSVVEDILRFVGVRVENKDCLKSEQNDSFCVNYPSQDHFYLLPGSALLSVKDSPGGQKEVFLEGLACFTKTVSYVNHGLIHQQTYLRLSQYLTALQSLTGEESLLYHSFSSSKTSNSTSASLVIFMSGIILAISFMSHL